MILPRYSKATTAYSSCYTLFPQQVCSSSCLLLQSHWFLLHPDLRTPTWWWWWWLQSETKNTESKTPRLLAERGGGLHITRVAEKALLRITKSRRTTPRNCHIFASSHHVHCNNCSKPEALKKHQWRTYISKHGYRESVSAQSSQPTRLVLPAVLLAVRTSKCISPEVTM
jgi:hypothetical protein